MIVNFYIEDKIDKSKYFQEIFLVINTKDEMILKIFFFKFNKANILFGNKTLT